LIPPRGALRRLAALSRLFRRATSGSTAVEYAVITGLLAAAIAASLGVVTAELYNTHVGIDDVLS
jgi:Flp pilus assembly pilin Flp